MINCYVCRKPIEKGLYIDPKTMTSMHRDCAAYHNGKWSKSIEAAVKEADNGKRREHKKED